MYQSPMRQYALVIFVKNPEHGKIKTRLAASIGDDKALNVYRQLLLHTKAVTENLPFDKIVFYSERIVEPDMWDENYYKQIQEGNNLGERMKNAFNFAFNNVHSKVVIIGTDCPGLNEQIITKAFKALDDTDVVIGPAFDGGYYLLGLNKLHSFLFEDIQWSTAQVLPATIEKCRHHQLSVSLLQQLHDIDEEKDLIHVQHHHTNIQ